ncbi:MAG: citramalate synthase [Candidatus Omnitrophica bacterium]|nr:citramalate synthase [Candidatus Omnitrophota bacterium]
MNYIELYDTTLRDGAQTEGISFSVHDKMRIAQKLDEIGIRYIEGGWPGVNPKDVAFFKRIREYDLKNAKIAAFGSTRRADTKSSQDKVLQGLLASEAEVITIFGKTWDLHVHEVLKTSSDENLRMIEDSLRFLRSKGRFVIFDAEHFFDGFKDNKEYAVKCLLAAQQGGAERIVLCDTNGGTLTSQVFDAVEEVVKVIRVPVGIHMHNDSEMAVANSVAAVQAGASHIQGTINGYGERCGNANLISIIANLKLKMGVDCITDIALKDLTELSHFVAEISNMKQEDNQPFVGRRAFAHKAGVHINAILKNSRSYEHIDPDRVGNRRRLIVSEHSGKSGIAKKAEEMNLGLDPAKADGQKILKTLQKLEHEGYHFESAEASLELFMRRAMHEFRDFFKLVDFRVIIEKKEKHSMTSEAVIKIKVGKTMEHTASTGDGPVNALDSALRKALKDFYPALSEMHLSDFKVRVLDEKAGTAAKVRVLVQSQDKNESWWTIGVSENIIEASWIALVDSVEYKLLKGSGKKK